jgi:hypothetical protein
MRFSWLSWKAAAAVAILMGLPMVEQAKADSASGITGSSLSLVGAIIDAIGNS